jgi:hypothetical protein
LEVEEVAFVCETLMVKANLEAAPRSRHRKVKEQWRLVLAERLNVHRYGTFFATRPSPTEAILHLWEARNREILALSNLINILRGMGRFDAAAVLEQQMH